MPLPLKNFTSAVKPNPNRNAQTSLKLRPNFKNSHKTGTMSKSPAALPQNATLKPAAKEKKRAATSRTAWSVELPVWQVAALCAAAGVCCFIYAQFSTGFYQDDEIGHYLRARTFFQNPLDHIGNWNKFGFKLIIALPSLLGMQAMMMFNVVITAATAFLTFIVAREHGIKNAPLAALFVLVQPMLIDLSFRVYSELMMAFFFAVLCYTYRKEWWITTAFLASYSFLIRQEMALVCLALGGIFLYRRQVLAFLLLAWSPVFLFTLGYLKTGDWLFILKDAYAAGVEAQFKRFGFWHYTLMLITIIGPATLAFFTAGLFGFLFQGNGQKGKQKTEANASALTGAGGTGGAWAYLREYHWWYLIFGIFFFFQSLTASEFLNKGVNPGNLRYMICLSPLFALFALLGYNALADRLKPFTLLTVFAGLAAVTLLFFSYKTNLIAYTGEPEYAKFLTLLALTAFAAWYLNAAQNPPQNSLQDTLQTNAKTLAAGTVALCVLPLFALLSPLKLSPENAAVKDYSLWAKQTYPDRKWLTNHNMVPFYAGMDYSDTLHLSMMYQKTIHAAPVGSIVLWDTHYSDRPEYQMDVPASFMEQHATSLKVLREFLSTDRRFLCRAYEKTAPLQ